MKKKRVVITGLGIVSCFGTDPERFYTALLEGKSGIRPIESFDCSGYPTRFAGSVQDFDVGAYMDRKQARRVDPFIRYAMVAGKKAIEDAKLTGTALDKLDKKRCGIIISSGMGGMNIFFDGSQTIVKDTYKRLTPFFVPYIITNMGGALLAIDTGFMGPNYSISTACATANYSIDAAANLIRKGDVDLMVCGGAEAAINPVGLSGFATMKALSTNNENPQGASRPFDKNRDGFVMGEGAGVLVLESLEHALKRKAPIYAEYLGGSTNCDAHHITSPREDGLGVASCIEDALQKAGVKKEDVNYINAHATATPNGDISEVRALKEVFSDQIHQVTINATKSLIGHCLGAAGGLEAIATIKAIEKGIVHPTINLKDPEDEVLDLDIPSEKKPLKIKVALSNSFGFGGHNSVLVFAPYES